MVPVQNNPPVPEPAAPAQTFSERLWNGTKAATTKVAGTATYMLFSPLIATAYLANKGLEAANAVAGTRAGTAASTVAGVAARGFTEAAVGAVHGFQKGIKKTPIVAGGRLVIGPEITGSAKIAHDIALKCEIISQRQPKNARWKGEAPAIPPASLAPQAPPPPPTLAEVLARPPASVDRPLGSHPPQENIDWQVETEKCLNGVVDNGAALAAIRLSFPKAETKTIMEIVQTYAEEKERGLSPSLWKLSMNRFSAHLTFFQKIRAYLFYTIFYSTGLISSSLRLFLKTIAKEFRTKLIGPNQEANLAPVLKKTLDHLDQFLIINREATEKYADLKRTGGLTVKDIRTQEMNKKIHSQSLQALCKEFSKTLVDGFFPTIPIFEFLKNSKFTRWLYAPISLLIGTPLNWIGKIIVKWFMPKVVQNIVEEGLNLRFATAVTVNLTQLFVGLTEEAERMEKDPKVNDSPDKVVPRSQQLDDVMTRLIDLIELAELKDDQEKLQKLLDDLKKPNLVDKAVRLGAAQGVNKILLSLAKDTQVTEKGLHDIFQILNDSLYSKPPITVAGAPQTQEEQHAHAVRALETAASALIDKGIQHFTKNLAGGKVGFKKMVDDTHAKIKEMAQANFASMNAILETILSKIKEEPPRSILVDLDHLRILIDSYASSVLSLSSNLNTQMVQEIIDKTFEPIHKKVEEMTQLLSNIQDLQVIYETAERLTDTFTRITGRLDDLKEVLQKNETDIEPFLRNIESFRFYLVPPYLSVESEIPRDMDRAIQDLRKIINEAKKEEKILEALKALDSEGGLIASLASAAKGNPPAGFNKKESNRQITKALSEVPDSQLLMLEIRKLQGASLKRGSPIDPITQSIQQMINQLRTDHQGKKAVQMGNATLLQKQFHAWAAKWQSCYKNEADKHFADLSMKLTSPAQIFTIVFKDFNKYLGDLNIDPTLEEHFEKNESILQRMVDQEKMVAKYRHPVSRELQEFQQIIITIKEHFRLLKEEHKLSLNIIKLRELLNKSIPKDPSRPVSERRRTEIKEIVDLFLEEEMDFKNLLLAQIYGVDPNRRETIRELIIVLADRRGRKKRALSDALFSTISNWTQAHPDQQLIPPERMERVSLDGRAQELYQLINESTPQVYIDATLPEDITATMTRYLEVNKKIMEKFKAGYNLILDSPGLTQMAVQAFMKEIIKAYKY